MEQSVEQLFLLRVQVVWKKNPERIRCINSTIWQISISILVMYQKHQSVHNYSENISYLFKFNRFSARRYIHYKWVNCSCAMLPWKKVVLVLLHQKWSILAVMGKYHSKLVMLFNPAFPIKCRYIYLLIFEVSSEKPP